MNRYRAIIVIGLAVLGTMFLCCGMLSYWLFHQSMNDKPELLYVHYEVELQEYASRLESGDERFVEGRGYGLPKYLIDHGARYCTKHGDCFCIEFGFMGDEDVPELWYSPRGFDPLPRELADANSKGVHKWTPLSPSWAACYR